MTDNQINTLPKNWTLKMLGEVCDVLDNKRKPINSQERQNRIFGKLEKDLFPYYGATGQVGFIDDFLTDGDFILLGEDGAPFLDSSKEKAYLISGKSWVNNHAHILKAKEKISSNVFIKHFLNILNYEGYVNGTTRLKLNQSSMKDIQIPLPPLPEQQKIVQKIESLFTDLETGTKALKTALNQLKIYRQAVLNHFLTNDSWDVVKGESLFEYITSGSRGWADYYSEEGSIFLRITNLNFNTFLLDLRENKIQRVNLLNVKEGLRTKVQEGDFLISITGYLGMFAIVPPDFPEAYVNQHIALCRPKIGYDKKFVGYFITSKNGGLKQFNDMQKGATKAGLSLNDIRNLQIPFPSLEIQTQIVAEIEKRMAGADALEASLKAQLITAENLRQSILKRAFEGKLV
jgi:type I restriction enzyme S subunit